jgi:hypothetical protein
MNRPLLVALSFCVTASLAAAAIARAEDASPGRRDAACRADVEKYCADAQRGGGGIARCLREHEKDLSPACREQLASLHEKASKRAAAVHAACKSETAKYCAEHEPGEGGLIRCLRGHEADLSKECREALPARGRP